MDFAQTVSEGSISESCHAVRFSLGHIFIVGADWGGSDVGPRLAAITVLHIRTHSLSEWNGQGASHMTLSPALTVAFAVKDGAPADVREWISVELAEFLVSGRRGFMVSTEAVRRTPEADELARHAREAIVDELRRQHLVPAEVALGRAFASANSVVYEQTHHGMPLDARPPMQIGATAVIVEDHVATFGHVPPGQLILIEDGLVYAVPDLQSWFPHYDDPNLDSPNPEPLGYGPRVAPVIAQTDLRSGDTVLLCSTECSRAFSEEMQLAGVSSSSLAFLHGRDPDKILDVFRDLVVEYDIADAAVTVLGFAPGRSSSQIRTAGDIGRRARDSWRSARGQMHQLLPAPNRGAAVAPTFSEKPLADAVRSTVIHEGQGDVPPAASMISEEPVAGIGSARLARRSRWRARTLRIAEQMVPTRKDTWQPPTSVRQFGVPGAHGVQGYRGNASDMGEESWRNRLPRFPAAQAIVWTLLCLVLILGIVGGVAMRERWFSSHDDYRQNLAAVDRSIVDARKLSDPTKSDDAFLSAQQELNGARSAGAPEGDLVPRQQAITDGRDTIHHVIRLEEVTRIGGLPDELQGGTTRAVRTPGGIFLVSGSLYQLQPDEKTIVRVLDEGSTVNDPTLGKVQVGKLYGVTYDSGGLYTTDGNHVFVYGTDNVWRVVKLGEINEQGPWPAGPIGAFDGNLYILEAQYRNIYRFTTHPEGKTSDAIDWVNTGSRPDLKQAVDMAIDGNIYVLLADGRVLTLYLGEIASDIAPSYLLTGQGDEVKSIVNGAATGYLYVSVVNGKNGRVVAFDRMGKEQYQLELPAGFSTQGVDVLAPFEQLQAITVNEDSGTLYLINGDAIWSARYRLPSLPPPEATPVATPVVPTG